MCWLQRVDSCSSGSPSPRPSDGGGSRTGRGCAPLLVRGRGAGRPARRHSASRIRVPADRGGRSLGEGRSARLSPRPRGDRGSQRLGEPVVPAHAPDPASGAEPESAPPPVGGRRLPTGERVDPLGRARHRARPARHPAWAGSHRATGRAVVPRLHPRPSRRLLRAEGTAHGCRARRTASGRGVALLARRW